MAAAVPRLFEFLERKPPTGAISPLRADQAAFAVNAIGDDVVKEVVLMPGRVDDLQHENDRPAVAQLLADQFRRACHDLRVVALLSRGEKHVDGHHSAAHFRQGVIPLLHRRQIAIVLEHRGQRTGAARFDAPLQHRHVRNDAGCGRWRLRARRHRDAGHGKDHKREKGEAPVRLRPFSNESGHVRMLRR